MTKKTTSLAERLAEELFLDMCDRRGFDAKDTCDEQVIAEWKNDWAEIIRKALDKQIADIIKILS